MNFPAIANLLASSLAFLFAVSALLHLAAPVLVRAVYARRQFARAAGMVQGMTALFMAVPETRIWGGILGAMILFTIVVSLLHHRRYAYAVPVILFMVALAPAMA